jgi:hypothetical protein
MTDADQQTDPRVTLFVRSLHPRGVAGRQDAAIERLETLADEGAIAAFEVVVWGDGLPLSAPGARTGPGRRARRAYERFREWAAATDRSIDGAFERRTSDSVLTGEHYEVVRFPAMALAEYAEGELRHVAPCTVDGERRTVEGRLDALARGPPAATGSDEPPHVGLQANGDD